VTAPRAEQARFERGRWVTGWKHEPWMVSGGWRVCPVRWVLTVEGWDQEQGEFTHVAPFGDYLQALAVAASFNAAAAP
jgi:hypothetical protein